MRYIYNFFLFLILPFLPLRLLWRSRKNKAYRRNVLERFGFFDFPVIKKSIWIHAVSVGEAISAVPLIRAIAERYPDEPIIVTTMTPTGGDRIKKIFKDKVKHIYVPFDYPFIIKRFLRQINPKILVIMETEIWPNMLHYSKKKKIPVILSNARLSLKSFAGYKKIKGFMKENLKCINMVLAQTKADGKRFLELGLDPKKLLVAGNVKFDIEVSKEISLAASEFKEVLGERLIWVAASTHKEEEEKVLVAAKKLLESVPDALLILVPRHPERFDYVFELCSLKGFDVVKYSNSKDYIKSTNVILGDVMGQMMMFYEVSDIAFVGGSLVPWGGHNLLEPAALSKPVLSGPHLSAFLEISQILNDAKAMVVVENEEELAEKLIELFQDESKREELGKAAIKVVEKYRGVTEKILHVVREVMSR